MKSEKQIKAKLKETEEVLKTYRYHSSSFRIQLDTLKWVLK